MKLNQLRTVIREEVRAAVKEELQDMLNEAVRVASIPQTEGRQVYKPIAKESIYAPSKPIHVEKQRPSHNNPVMEMLEQTKASMAAGDYQDVFNGTADMVSKPNFASSMANQRGMTQGRGAHPGLDISQFDFVKKAGAVYKASVEIDKKKNSFA